MMKMQRLYEDNKDHDDNDLGLKPNRATVTGGT